MLKTTAIEDDKVERVWKRREVRLKRTSRIAEMDFVTLVSRGLEGLWFIKVTSAQLHYPNYLVRNSLNTLGLLVIENGASYSWERRISCTGIHCTGCAYRPFDTSTEKLTLALATQILPSVMVKLFLAILAMQKGDQVLVGRVCPWVHPLIMEGEFSHGISNCI